SADAQRSSGHCFPGGAARCGTRVIAGTIGLAVGVASSLSPICAGTCDASHAHVGYGADWHEPRYRHGAPVSGLADLHSVTPQSPVSHTTARRLQWASDTTLAHYAGGTGPRARRLWTLTLAGGGWRVGLWVSRLLGARAGGLLSHPPGISG